MKTTLDKEGRIIIPLTKAKISKTSKANKISRVDTRMKKKSKTSKTAIKKGGLKAFSVKNLLMRRDKTILQKS
jgi:hypothetical protein